MKQSEFRLWVENLWRENCDEHYNWQEKPYTLSEYFNKFKYWLKREYRHQTKNK